MKQPRDKNIQTAFRYDFNQELMGPVPQTTKWKSSTHVGQLILHTSFRLQPHPQKRCAESTPAQLKHICKLMEASIGSKVTQQLESDVNEQTWFAYVQWFCCFAVSSMLRIPCGILLTKFWTNKVLKSNACMFINK